MVDTLVPVVAAVALVFAGALGWIALDDHLRTRRMNATLKARFGTQREQADAAARWAGRK